ncbi:FG-GAP repeat domain-containing protein [Actinomadura fibrosa]|uniref:FG-GAP repeat domain-containing protein n=1 Tax=Actinomadura fibrosa TaxID=111802 RepID=A0ABW2XB73_9ACTN|nr:VCBS repeat-containing protein [Actinomadura fibrosa]
MRFRAVLAAAVVAFGAVAGVVVVRSGGGSGGGASRSGGARAAAPYREISNSLPSGVVSAAVRKPAAPGDFNGDGYRDIAGGGFDGTRGDTALVTVVYGGPAGADPARHQVVAQPDGPRNVPGWQVESADFDSDGYADLLSHRAGTTTTIVYGGPRGLTLRTAALPEATGDLAVGDFDSNGVPDVASTKDSEDAGGVYDTQTAVVVYANPGARPGKTIVSGLVQRGDYSVQRTLLAGDFTGDHRTDLLVGTRNELDGEPTSWFELRPGTSAGLGPARLLPYGRAEINAADAVAGDFDGDGRTDLVARAAGGGTRKGGLQVVSLTAGGRGFGKPRRFDDAALGMSGRAGVLRADDVNADGRADLIVGFYNPSDVEPGVVSILFGSRSGLTAKGRRTLREDSKGVPGTVRPSDRFGTELSLTDTDRDGRIDLVVGAPGEEGGEGHLYIFPGTAAGPSIKGIRHFGAAALGIGGRKTELGGHLLR